MTCDVTCSKLAIFIKLILLVRLKNYQILDLNLKSLLSIFNISNKLKIFKNNIHNVFYNIFNTHL